MLSNWIELAYFQLSCPAPAIVFIEDIEGVNLLWEDFGYYLEIKRKKDF